VAFDPGGPLPILQPALVAAIDPEDLRPIPRPKREDNWWLHVEPHLTDYTSPIPAPFADDTATLPTPLRPAAWKWALRDCPNTEAAEFIHRTISEGADIQFIGDRELQVDTENLRSATFFPEAVDKYIRTEREAGRISEPLTTRPSSTKRIVPLGSVPKGEDKRRIILNYSAPEGSAVNEEIHKLECQLQSFDVAMDRMATLPKASMMSKLDVEHAFRLIPVRPSDRGLLGMKWKGQYFEDHCLPFGLSSSPPHLGAFLKSP
jgi:hypothetical protein